MPLIGTKATGRCYGHDKKRTLAQIFATEGEEASDTLFS